MTLELPLFSERVRRRRQAAAHTLGHGRGVRDSAGVGAAPPPLAWPRVSPEHKLLSPGPLCLPLQPFAVARADRLCTERGKHPPSLGSGRASCYRWRGCAVLGEAPRGAFV